MIKVDKDCDCDKFFVMVDGELHCEADSMEEAKDNVREALDDGVDLDDIVVYSATVKEFTTTEEITVEFD